MAIIATFKVFPITAFSNRPGGTNDPFVMSDNSTSQLLTVTIDDDDGLIDGDNIVEETADDANQIATVTDADGNVVSVDAIYVEWTSTYTGTNGQVIEVWRFELDNGLRMFAMSEIPEEGVTYTTSNKDQSATGLDPIDIPDTPCFTTGVLIETKNGERRVEELAVGDPVMTVDSGFQNVRWLGSRKFKRQALEANPKLFPVKILEGALGNGLPHTDLLVSRQHRMQISSKISQRMFGEPDVLVAAIRLTELPGIFVDETVESVEYHHVLFSKHEIVLANGAPSESLFTGPQALKSILPEALEEIYSIFPDLKDSSYIAKSARLIPTEKKQKQLVNRMGKNFKNPLETYTTSF